MLRMLRTLCTQVVVVASLAALVVLLAMGVPLLNTAAQVRCVVPRCAALHVTGLPGEHNRALGLLGTRWWSDWFLPGQGGRSFKPFSCLLELYTHLPPACAARRLLPRHGPTDGGLALRAGDGAPCLRLCHCCHCLPVRGVGPHGGSCGGCWGRGLGWGYVVEGPSRRVGRARRGGGRAGSGSGGKGPFGAG